MNAEYASMKTHEIEDLIRALQNVQKRCSPSSEAWREASEQLKPLFTEMADRS